MKKLVFTLALASVLGSGQVDAQGLVKKVMENMYGGPKVEGNASNFFLSGMPGVKSKMNVGGSIGGFIGIRMSEHFAIQEDIMVNYKTSSLKQKGKKGNFEYLGAELAFYAMGNWKMNNGNRFSIGVGPYIGYGLDAKYKVNDEEINLYKKGSEVEIPFSRFSLGAALTAGYEFKCGFQINASYKLGIMDMLDLNKSNMSMLPSTVSLGVAYRFGK